MPDMIQDVDGSILRRVFDIPWMILCISQAQAGPFVVLCCLHDVSGQVVSAPAPQRDLRAGFNSMDLYAGRVRPGTQRKTFVFVWCQLDQHISG